MTHLEALLEVLQEYKEHFTTQTTAAGTEVEISNTGKHGYNGFFSAWTFDRDGKLTSISHWE